MSYQFPKGNNIWKLRKIEGGKYKRTEEQKNSISEKNKGKNYSPETQFKRGQIAWNYIDGRSKNGESQRGRTQRHDGKIVIKAHLVWCSQPGNLNYIPKGFVIHHIDGNHHNNDLNNLFLMAQADHAKMHNDALAVIL